ncbi:hypothetical protein [Hafnia psychrotolerans]|uniref:Uncharacterized protein n=1 Tax=Hafnia psychrotolerans TaxID=1477018 RepID=A0ABQ1G7V7_9GAMM|nr:hypothetical protein [Hafnia psychrotolerans]GGA38471.1 hypothetical protein GCM10011328_11630 [Hafnia psychrotolerans]
MELQEWLGKLKGLSSEQLIKTHFGLQEKIKKHYKLRGEGNNLKKAISLCEQQIAMAPLVIKAMRDKHHEDLKVLSEINRNISEPDISDEFYAPAHHGYRQLCVILRKLKQFERVAELEVKRNAEGWSK